MNNDLLAKGGRHDVVRATKRCENSILDQSANGLEPVSFADQGYTSAEDDPGGSQQGDGLTQGKGQALPGTGEDGLRPLVPFDGRLRDGACRDCAGSFFGTHEHNPLALFLTRKDDRFVASLLGDAPAGGDFFQLLNSNPAVRSHRNLHVANLHGSEAAPTIDPAIGYECATDSAANSEIE